MIRSKEPTSEYSLAVAASLRDAMGRLGFRPEKFPFREQIGELEWLGRGRGSIFRPSGPWHKDLRRARDAFFWLFRLAPLNDMLSEATALSGAKHALQHALKSRLESQLVVAEQAGDRLLEFEVASALSRVLPGQVRLGVNDVVVLQDDGKDLGVECKRPRRAETIARNVKEAVRQLDGRPGFVVVSLDKIINRPWIRVAGSAVEGLLMGQLQVEEVLQNGIREGIIRSLPGSRISCDGELNGAVFGVFVCALIGVMVRSEGQGGDVMRAHLAWTSLSHPDAELEAKIQHGFINQFLAFGFEQALSAFGRYDDYPI